MTGSTFLHFGQHSCLERAYRSHLIRHNLGADTWFCHSGLCNNNQKVRPWSLRTTKPCGLYPTRQWQKISLWQASSESCVGRWRAISAELIHTSALEGGMTIFHLVKSLTYMRALRYIWAPAAPPGVALFPPTTPTAAAVHGGPAVALQTLELQPAESAKGDGGVIYAVSLAPLLLMESRLEVTQTYLTLMVGTRRANC